MHITYEGEKLVNGGSVTKGSKLTIRTYSGNRAINIFNHMIVDNTFKNLGRCIYGSREIGC